MWRQPPGPRLVDDSYYDPAWGAPQYEYEEDVLDLDDIADAVVADMDFSPRATYGAYYQAPTRYGFDSTDTGCERCSDRAPTATEVFTDHAVRGAGFGLGFAGVLLVLSSIFRR